MIKVYYIITGAVTAHYSMDTVVVKHNYNDNNKQHCVTFTTGKLWYDKHTSWTQALVSEKNILYTLTDVFSETSACGDAYKWWQRGIWK